MSDPVERRGRPGMLGCHVVSGGVIAIHLADNNNHGRDC